MGSFRVDWRILIHAFQGTMTIDTEKKIAHIIADGQELTSNIGVTETTGGCWYTTGFHNLNGLVIHNRQVTEIAYNLCLTRNKNVSKLSHVKVTVMSNGRSRRLMFPLRGTVSFKN